MGQLGLLLFNLLVSFIIFNFMIEDKIDGVLFDFINSRLSSQFFYNLIKF